MTAAEIKQAFKTRKIKSRDFIHDTEGVFSESHISHLLSGNVKLGKAEILMFKLYFQLYDLKKAAQSSD